MKIVEGLDKEVKSFKTEIMKLMWYMRGAITLDEAYMMAPDDREIIAEIVKDNLETTKKSGLPFF